LLAKYPNGVDEKYYEVNTGYLVGKYLKMARPHIEELLAESNANIPTVTE